MMLVGILVAFMSCRGGGQWSSADGCGKPALAGNSLQVRGGVSPTEGYGKRYTSANDLAEYLRVNRRTISSYLSELHERGAILSGQDGGNGALFILICGPQSTTKDRYSQAELTKDEPQATRESHTDRVEDQRAELLALMPEYPSDNRVCTKVLGPPKGSALVAPVLAEDQAEVASAGDEPRADDLAELANASFVPLPDDPAASYEAPDDLADAAGADIGPSADDQAGAVGASFVPLPDDLTAGSERFDDLADDLADAAGAGYERFDDLADAAGLDTTPSADDQAEPAGASFVPLPDDLADGQAVSHALRARELDNQADDQAKTTGASHVPLADDQADAPGASYDPALDQIAAAAEKSAPRRRNGKDPIRKKLDDAREQVESWRAMSLPELERERYKLDRASQDCERPPQHVNCSGRWCQGLTARSGANVRKAFRPCIRLRMPLPCRPRLSRPRRRRGSCGERGARRSRGVIGSRSRCRCERCRRESTRSPRWEPIRRQCGRRTSIARRCWRGRVRGDRVAHTVRSSVCGYRAVCYVRMVG